LAIFIFGIINKIIFMTFSHFYRLIFILTIFGLFIWLGAQNFMPQTELLLEWTPEGRGKFVSDIYPQERVLNVWEENNSYSKVLFEPIYFFVYLPKSFKKAEVNLIYQSDLDIRIGLMYRQGVLPNWQFDLKDIKEKNIGMDIWKNGEVEFNITSEFINKKNRFNGLEFIISIPEIYKKEGDVKIKKIEILLKN